MKLKILYDNEWVSAKPRLSKRFPVDDPACEICRSASCATSWVSVTRRVVRCRKCFTPTSLDDSGTGINARRLIKGQRGSLQLSDREDVQELLERIQPFVESIEDLNYRKRLISEINRELKIG